jgi:hypothetical protein
LVLIQQFQIPNTKAERLQNGRIGMQVGWKHGKAVAELEEKRLAKSSKYYETKKKLIALRAKAEAQVPKA